jgi:four helix bundle protein
MMKNKYFVDNGVSFIEEATITYDVNKDFTSLKAWRKARKVKLFFYKTVLPLLPKEERYTLGSQIRRTAISSIVNIAEVYGRFYYQEGIQFYRISRGSHYELKDHLISCFDLGYINKELLDKDFSLIEEAKKTLNGYIRFVTKQKSRKT